MRYWFVGLALGASVLLCGPVLWAIGDAIPYCRAVALGDLDADGDLDAFLANGRSEGFEPNTVWLNDGTGHLHQRGLSRTVVYGAIGIGILVVIVLSAFGWWVIRRSIVGGKKG